MIKEHYYIINYVPNESTNIKNLTIFLCNMKNIYPTTNANNTIQVFILFVLDYYINKLTHINHVIKCVRINVFIKQFL